MPKRWAGWPHGVRWVPWIGVVVLALAITWALFVPIADWLARYDVGSATGPLHETALDNARGRLLTLAAGLFAAGALVFTARNFTLSRRALELSEQGQVTERYTKAIEQLGSDKLDVRIGGIYALERVARDSPRDQPTVMEVLTAFIRERSLEQWPLPAPDAPVRQRRTRPDFLAVSIPEHSAEQSPPDPPGRGQKGWTRPDVQAALTVVGRRDQGRGFQGIDLVGAILTGANLSRANLMSAGLFGSDLSGARLDRAILTGADLSGADLTRARLFFAQLAAADLTGAVLAGAQLTEARLAGAFLGGADLTGAVLYRANLEGASLVGACLSGANLTEACLADANLEGARLDGALWPQDSAVPEGWERDTGSGRLQREGTDPGPAETD